MTKKIIEIQGKIEKLNGDIAAHRDLLVEQESDYDNFEKILEQLNDQRNELLIADRMGADNKAQIAETDKNIKATKAAIEKQKERVSFLKSVKQKLNGKNDLLLKLADDHKAAIVEYLSNMVAIESTKRNEIYAAYTGKIKDIAALESILGGFKDRSIVCSASQNESLIADLLQKAGGVFADNSLAIEVEKIKAEYVANLKKAGVNL